MVSISWLVRNKVDVLCKTFRDSYWIMGNSILFPFTSLTCIKEWPLELNWILYFLCTGNFICFSIVYYPSDPSLPVAKLTNAGLVSFWPFDFFFFFLFLGQVISSMNLQVLPDDMLDFLDAPVPYIVSDFLFFCRFPHSWCQRNMVIEMNT